MGSLANGSERFTGMWGAHQRTVQNGSLVANYLELFGTIWNYVVWAVFLRANGSERFTNIPANHLELNVFAYMTSTSSTCVLNLN